jgi:chromate transport protein ChrA
MYKEFRSQYSLYSVVVILIAEYLWSSLKDVNREKVITSILSGIIIAIALAFPLDDPILLSRASKA